MCLYQTGFRQAGMLYTQYRKYKTVIGSIVLVASAKWSIMKVLNAENT
jgi:hypothetical protein